MNRVEADVCIVGAGYAGLAAAYRLQKAGKSVAVLEARNRVGGRVFTEHLPDGTPVNHGGTWLGEGHDRMYAIAKEMGVETYRQYVKGDSLVILDGKVHRFSGSLPRLNPLALIDVGLAIKMLEWMASHVPLDAPWEADKGPHEWDSQTLGAWIDSRLHATTNTAQKLLRTILGGEFMCDPSEVSLLHALYFIHAFKSMDWIMSAIGGAQQDLIVGGMQGIADRIAAKLGKAVHLQAPVRRLTQDAGGVEVTADTLTVKARRVIVAAPPILAGRIAYDPPLPALKSQLMDRSPAGQGIKCHAIYSEPFWRADGFSGQGADLDAAPSLSLDVTPPSGKPGVLQAFAAGPAARQLAVLAPEERHRVFLDGLVKRFGPKAATPTYYDEHDWAADEWSRGDMFAHYAPGVLTGFGKALRAPCGRIHWAGTETATRWAGCIEGAVHSGERAADEVLNAD